jgi:D-glycero-alpha-D-manno-heptose 1-phosphate guanylyltransferase
VSNVPKPMAPIGGHPFLELLLSSLKSKGISRAILSIGYMADAITSYFKHHPVGIDLQYEIESTALGTGGAIAAALKRATCDAVFVFNGDTYLDLDLSALASMWPGDHTPIVVARFVPDAERFGKLECTRGRIAKFLGAGHQGPGIINGGCYVIPKNIFGSVALPAAFSFESDFLARRAPSSLRVFVTDARFFDIGVPEDYRRAQVELPRLLQLHR